MLIFVRNFMQRSQTMHLKFNKTANGNYSLPVTDLYTKLNPTSDFWFYRTQKLRPHEPWGDFDIELIVDNEDLDGNDVKWRYNWPQLRSTRPSELNLPL